MTSSGPSEPAAFSHIVEIESLAKNGAWITVEPSDKDREAIASRLDTPALRRLIGKFHLTPIRGGVDILLTLDAEAERTCVVTLEPMMEVVHETIPMQFVRGLRDDDADDPDNQVLREPLDSDAIDLGEILVQHLSLSLSPHPRKANADEILEKYRGAPLASPFAALKGVVDRDN